MQSILLALPFFTACAVSSIGGNGQSKTEVRPLADFASIEVNGAMSAEIEAGAEFKVEVTADSNLLDHIKTDVRGGVLTIGANGFISPKTSMVVRVWMPRVEKVAVSGASKAVVKKLAGETFAARASGASELEISGEIARLEVEISGASELDAKQVSAGAVEIEASGASRASARAAKTIAVEASGASTVDVEGEGKVEKRSASGASTIRINGAKTE